MGRKLRGAALRAHKRGKAHAYGIVEEKASQVERQAVVEQSNEELFVIDTTGDSKAKVPPQLKELPSKKELAQGKKGVKKPALPTLDQQRVEQLLEKHDSKKLQAMVKEGQAKLRGDRGFASQQQKKKKFDLWGEEEQDNKNNESKNNISATAKKIVSSKQDLKEANAKMDKVHKVGGVIAGHIATVAEPISKKPSNAVAVDVAHAGQSYRPDPQHYQKVVQDAVSLELRRQKAQDHAKAPLATGMSPETRALLVGDSSSSEDEDSDEEYNNNNTSDGLLLRKRPEKLTRAERNKQKRLRTEKAIQEKEKQNKKLLKSVAEIPRFKKEIKKHEHELEEKRTQMEEEKKSKMATPGKDVLQRISEKDPIHAPTLPVALEAEHKDSSLRTLKPKGSLVTDRMASFVDRNLVSKRKMGDKKRVMQGKRRKLNVKGKGHEIAKAMDHALMG